MSIASAHSTYLAAPLLWITLETHHCPQAGLFGLLQPAHGQDLLLLQSNGTTRLQDFLRSCHITEKIATLCNQWSQEQGVIVGVTTKQIETFDALLGRGLMAVARDTLCQPDHSWPLEHIHISSGALISGDSI
jgi:hypothetical protein